MKKDLQEHLDNHKLVQPPTQQVPQMFCKALVTGKIKMTSIIQMVGKVRMKGTLSLSLSLSVI